MMKIKYNMTAIAAVIALTISGCGEKTTNNQLYNLFDFIKV